MFLRFRTKDSEINGKIYVKIQHIHTNIFKSIDDYEKPVDYLKREDFFSNLKIGYANKTERTTGIV